MKQETNIFYYLILSITAATLLLILTFLGSSDIKPITIDDKLLLSGVFIICCIFGISLAIRPGWFKRFTQHRQILENNKQSQKTTRKREGHHPDCHKFQNHIITIKNKTFCAGCLGLSIGSVISIFLIIIYIISTIEQPSTIFYLLIFLGLIIIGLIYLEIVLPIRHSIVHVISNATLVISFLMITIGIFEITGNKIYGLLSVLLSFLWLDTRIQLSKWRHTIICNTCKELCKIGFIIF